MKAGGEREKQQQQQQKPQCRYSTRKGYFHGIWQGDAHADDNRDQVSEVDSYRPKPVARLQQQGHGRESENP